MSGSLWDRLNSKSNNNQAEQKPAQEKPKPKPSPTPNPMPRPVEKVEQPSQQQGGGIKADFERKKAEEQKAAELAKMKANQGKGKNNSPVLKRTTMKRDDFLEVKGKVQDVLLKEFSAAELKANSHEPEFKIKVQRRIRELIGMQNLPLTADQKEDLSVVLLNDTIGYGPIQPLLDDDSISEIMVNHENQIYVERNGKLILTEIFFDDAAQVLKIADKILSPLNRHVDESSPYVDARLPDGSRVNIIIPPLAIKGPCMTIRKFAKDPYTIDNLIEFGTLSPQMAHFIEACVKARLNIVVSGGTGSGKTTTLNVLSSFIPTDERIVTIEDAAELQLRQDHVITLESRNNPSGGQQPVTIRHLVANSLRMRPDRIVVGECRSGEALDMLQAMNTGHDGSMTTGHANTPRDMLSRLETMVLMAGMDLPVRAIREQISSAVDVIIQQSRLKDGSRRITHITEVQGMEGDTIVLQDLFLFNQTGFSEEGKIIGDLKSTGIRPNFMPTFEAFNIQIPADIFKK